MNRIILAAAFALVASTTVAGAHEGRGYGWGGGWWQHRQTERQAEIDRRQASQQSRIERGVRSGQITTGEYQRLQAEQARIRRMEAEARRDGRISRYEAWQIRRAQDAASQHIREDRHNSSSGRRW